MLEINESRQSLVSFLINLCAIAGGIFTISGVLDSITFHIQMVTEKTKELILPTTKYQSNV